MTGAEMERAIEFLLESQASLTTKIDQLTEHQERNESSIERLQGSIEGLQGSIDGLQISVGRLAEEAAADRSEVRAAVNTMLAFAESMSDNVKLLTKVQQATAQRLDRIDARFDALEK